MVVVPKYRELHVKKALRNRRMSSKKMARIVFRRKVESESGKQIDRRGGGIMEEERRLVKWADRAVPDICTLLSKCVAIMVLLLLVNVAMWSTKI
mmetsp:Transcript_22543/g.35370  ORF Transcript_22543/g.35370 Transcript_22543/m.35370 type:complete len:95 (+) Transcript_22543:152-436(+)